MTGVAHVKRVPVAFAGDYVGDQVVEILRRAAGVAVAGRKGGDPVGRLLPYWWRGR